MLFAAYAATLGIDASGGRDHTVGEARVLMAVESIVSDRDVDLRDEYRDRVWTDWTAGPVEPVSGLTDGRLHEPPGVGLPLLLAPAYAIAGPTGAALFIEALLALGFVAAAALARHLVPDPWATAAAVAGGLSPPALAWSTAVSPEAVAAAALAGAALFTLRARQEPFLRRAAFAALLIGLLPWLSVKMLPAAAVCAAALARWLRRRSRGMTAFAALEIVLVPAVALLTVNERLYGGVTPYAAVLGEPTGASGLAEHVARAPRLIEALLDPQVGLLVWAPVGAMAFLTLELLARSLRERLAVALPGVVDVEVSAAFLAAVFGAQLAVAAFLAPSLDGQAFPGRELIAVLPVGAALTAWGLRHAPRLGRILIAATVGASVWLLIGARLGDGAGLAPPRGPLPWGGAELAVAAAVTAAIVFLLARELLRERELR